MNRGSTGIIIAIISIIILGGVGFYVFNNNQTNSDTSTDSLPTTVYETDDTPESMDDTTEPTSTTEPNSEAMANAYVEYSPEALEQGVGKTRVLFFFANWCPTCIPVDTELQANVSEIPEGTIVYRVNYNDSDTDAEEEALAAKYNVTYQHTFVIIDNEGTEVTKWNGGGLDRILSEL